MAASRNNNLPVLILLLVLCALSFGMSAAFFRVPTPAQASTFNSEYTLVFTDYNGNQVHLYDYRRSVLIAYAWASWCPYCASELQDLGELKNTYGDQIQIVAINRGESLQTARGFTNNIPDTSGIVFLLDPSDSFFKAIGGYAMPEMVFIDGSGNIIYHQRGPIQLPAVQAEIEKLIPTQ